MHHVEVVTRLEDSHLEDLPELIQAAGAADGHEPLGEHKFLRLKQGDDLAVAVLAYEEQRLVGYAHTLAFGEGASRRVSAEIVVHPDQRRRGIGGLLLGQALSHAQTQAAGRIDVWAYNDSPASARTAAHFGFRPLRRLLHLHRHIAGMPKVNAPEGVRVRAFRPGEDDAPWLSLNNRIFSGHPEQGIWTLEDLRARMAQPWFSPDDFLVIDVHGQMAGFCWLKVEDRGTDGRVGEIYVIGTAPERRGLGLGRFILSDALGHLRDRGARIAAIYVDESNGAAVALYDSAGFHHHHVDVCYTRSIAAGDSIDRPVAAA